MFRPNFLLLTLVMVAVILHGSLYPYAFRVPPGDIGAWQALLRSWGRPPSSFGDLAANILLYIPFGLFGAMAVRLRPLPRLLLIAGAGLGLCTAIELAQFYDQGRVTNLSDIYLNTFGALLGAAAAAGLDGLPRASLLRPLSRSPVAALLLAAMLGYHLFPYVPTIDLHKYWQSLKPLVLTPEIAPYPLFHYFALWLTASCLVAALAPGWPIAAAVLFCALVLASKVVIINLVVTAPELLGAGLALIGWMLLPKRRRGTALAVVLVLGTMVLIERLEPFAFRASATRFGWVPFRSFMSGSLSVNVQSFAEKFFLYGSCVWLLREAGLRLRRAAVLTALLLFVTSYAEAWLPGRSAEITDAVMAVLAAAIIGMLEPEGGALGSAGPARLLSS